MNELKVLVCDDIPARGKDTVHKIGNARDRLGNAEFGIRVEELFEEALSKELEALFAHVAEHLPTGDDGQSHGVPPRDLSEFDCDIVVIDNNLAALDIKGVRLTAEAVAGFVRAFTNARYIVSLNKNPEVDFDLRYLVGDYRTQADLALNADHLSNPALWTGNPRDTEDGFLPWYWPVLGNVSEKRRKQVEFVRIHLQSPICETLDFPRRAVEYLSRHAVGALTPEASTDDDGIWDPTSLSTVTFMDFFLHSCRSLPVYADRESLARQATDASEVSREVVARIVAAEIDKWFRRDVIGPQDVLVDLPHLLMRMPFLLGDKVADVDRWHDSMMTEKPPFGLDQEIYDKHVGKARFSHDRLLKSPCFWWPKLKENETLNDLFFGSNGNWPDVVFCEDVSQFRNFSPRSEDTKPMEFAAEFEGSWSRRYASLLPCKKYSPKSRFAQ